MLQAGDFDLVQPLFRMYREALPLARERTRRYYGHAGAFFPETMYFWGTYNNDNYGWNRAGKPDGLTDNTYIRYYWDGARNRTTGATTDRVMTVDVLAEYAHDHRFAEHEHDRNADPALYLHAGKTSRQFVAHMLNRTAGPARTQRARELKPQGGSLWHAALDGVSPESEGVLRCWCSRPRPDPDLRPTGHQDPVPSVAPNHRACHPRRHRAWVHR